MGTKHWTTIKLTSSRYPGRTIAGYPNEAGHVFQSGTSSPFTTTELADIDDSPDCGPNITMEVSESEHPYTDIDARLYDNGSLVDTIGITDTKTYHIDVGHTVTAAVTTASFPTGRTSQIRMNFIKNGVSLYSNLINDPVSGAIITYTDPTTVASGDTYDIVCDSSGANFPNPFILKSQAGIGVTIVDVMDAVSGGTTGIPSGATGANVTPGSYSSFTYTTVTSGHITINTTGFSAGASIALYVNDIEVSVAGMTSGVNTYDLLLPSTVNSSTPIMLVVKNY